MLYILISYSVPVLTSFQSYSCWSGACYDPVPMDHLLLQCDGKTDTPGSSLMGKDVSDACFDFLLGTSADYFKGYG